MVNHTIGSYEIVRVLHEGSTCTLYVAYDPELERDVVIKVLNSLQILDEEVKVRFLREARSAAVLEHPNICSIFALCNTADGLHYFVMPLYRGETLRDTLARQDLSLEQALSNAQQVAYAIGHAHSHGVIHRDLKPENVFVTAEALVKLLDFGVAKLGNDNITRDGSLMGTVAYMAPEQIEGAPASVQTDIWAWGTMFFEMLSGHVPYAYAQGLDMMAAIRDDPVPNLPAQVLGGIDAAQFQPLIGACLAKDPAQRARSMRDIVQLLEPLITETPSITTVPTRLLVSTVPVWHKPFVGRDAERSRLTSKVTEGAKLLTLSGQAGVGKTHLALACLYDPAIHVLFPAGMLYVPVADTDAVGVSDADRLFLPSPQGIDGQAFERFAQQLADTLEHNLACHIDRPPPWEAGRSRAPTSGLPTSGLPTSGALTSGALAARVRLWQQALSAAIASKRVLLLIDGVHRPLAGLGTLLEQLTQFCENITILTTARQRLGVPSEQVVVVDALPLPEQVHLPEQAHRVMANPAAQLFVRTSQRALRPAEENALLRLCQLLGGWPAALELAAQWHAQRDVHALADAAESFDIGARQGLPGLRDLLDAMWAGLNWQEASALARLASLGEYISFATANYVAEVSAELLVTLLDKHMLERDHSMPETYRVNRLILRYAQYKLNSAPSLQATLQQRLADYLARRLTGVAPEHLVMTSSLLPTADTSQTHDVPLNQVEWHTLPTAWQVWIERPPKRFAAMMIIVSGRASYVYEEAMAAALLEQAQQRFSDFQQQLDAQKTLSTRQQQQWQQLVQLRYVAALRATCQHLRLHDASTARRCFEVLSEEHVRDLVMDVWSTDATLSDMTSTDAASTDAASTDAASTMPTAWSEPTPKDADVDLWGGVSEGADMSGGRNGQDMFASSAFESSTFESSTFENSTFENSFGEDGEAASQRWQRNELQRALERSLIEAILLLAEGQRTAAEHIYHALIGRYGDTAWSLMTAPTLTRLASLAAHFGASEHALAILQRAAKSYVERADTWGQQLMSVADAFIRWGQGDLQPAADTLQAVLEQSQASPVAHLQSGLLLADVRFEQGQWQVASHHFDQAHSQLVDMSSAREHLIATALAGLAKVTSVQGDTVVAYAYLQQALEHAEHAPLRVLEAAASVYLHSKNIDEAALILVHLASYPEHRFVRDIGLDVPLPDERLHQNIAALLEQVRYLADESTWRMLESQAATLTLAAVLEHVRDQLSSSEYSFDF